MTLTIKEVEHVANLARLDLAEGEAERFKGQIDAILSYVEKLKQLNTDGVEPTSHAIPVNNVFREDNIMQPLGQERALANAPDKADGCFRVPKVVE
ncbi:MAG: Asp-tRNA(Asn)/Glu-tRNA(Gln) amidotransferase subunit GatC [Deltaproteobacteria bacterium]|nr:Asp-tRNA(Asn)/Glu-tRNA(Gln) amidotransferase subunit GatC [Deltaproteobacteria bacterium]